VVGIEVVVVALAENQKRRVVKKIGDIKRDPRRLVLRKS